MRTTVPDFTERFRYWQGQKLLSRDLRDQLATDAQMRWRHNRALHNAYGVSYGLGARLEAGKIVVESGVAYDCFGRELILQRERKFELPLPAGQEMLLMIRYKVTSEYVRSQDLLGVCLPCENAHSLEEPEFFWALEESVTFRDGVPIARLAEGNLDAGFRALVSRPLARPRIGGGATVPGDTAWELWSVIARRGTGANSARGEVNIGIQVTIDTSASGFTQTPCYFAWLQGSLWSRANIEFFPLALDHVANASIRRFTFRLWMPAVNAVIGLRRRALNSNFQTEFLNYAREQKLYVCWMGVQHTT
ncbi:MAG: hypothetical protein ACREAB_15690 [Blastocatellia bacterium]